MKTDRKNSITKRKEEATSKKVESMEIGFRKIWILGAVERWELWPKRRERGRGAHRRMHREMLPQTHLLGKQRRLNFMSCHNQWNLKPRVLQRQRQMIRDF